MTIMVDVLVNISVKLTCIMVGPRGMTMAYSRSIYCRAFIAEQIELGSCCV